MVTGRGPPYHPAMEDRSSDDASLEDRLLDDILLRRAQGHAIDPEAELAHLDPSAQARIRARLAELSDGPRATVLPAGARLGEFELMAELGRGAMGVVWRAWQPVLRRHVAIKVLPRLAALDPRRVERFQREAKALAALRHPGIVPVLSAGQQDGAFWFAMDLVDGASLAALLAGVEQRHPAQRTVAELFEPHRIVGPDRTPSYLAWVCATLADAADAVAHAHHQGVLHRDLKPSNLMVTRDGRIRIIDFGLARDLTDESESLTQSTDLVGSLAYMAPEQLQKQPAEPSPLADIWSLGVVLYEALAGRRPHVDDDRRVLIAKIAHMPVPPLQRWHPRLPRDLITICHKALEQEPERRYASAAAFAADLRAFLDLRPITASAPSWPRRLVLPARGWRWRLGWCRRSSSPARRRGARCATSGKSWTPSG